MLLVGTDPIEVDRLLTDGELGCLDCGSELRPWDSAWSRVVRDKDVVVSSRPRCFICLGGSCTHVLLPASLLARRADTAVVIGGALLAKATGLGHRPIALLMGRPESTVRGCQLRRFGAGAQSIRVLFTGLLHALDATVGAASPTEQLRAVVNKAVRGRPVASTGLPRNRRPQSHLIHG